MRKTIGLILALTTLTEAQVPEPRAVVSPAIIDFGKVQSGEVVEGVFNIMNTGTAPLEIQKIVSSCGCMLTASPAKFVQPNETVPVNAKFLSKGFFGPQVKNLRIYTNDPEANSVLLTFRGEVIREFKIEPAQFFFGDVLKGTERKVKVTITSTKPDIKIGQIASKSDLLALSVSDNGKDGSLSKTIEVSVKPDAPIGIVRSLILVHTTSTNEPVVAIPTFARVQGELQLAPDYISFDLLEAPLAGPVVKSVDLKNVGSDLPNITSIESDSPFVSAQFKVLKPGKLFEIRVVLNEQSKGIIKAKLTINTDRLDESRKSVTLPVYAFVTKKGE
jgi:hypothetical protein